MKLESGDDQQMVVSAIRYCLGRQTYIVSTCVQWVLTIWEQLDSNLQCVILQDIAGALMDDRAGSQYDQDDWKYLLRCLMSGIGETRQKEVKDSLSWKSQPWPL